MLVSIYLFGKEITRKEIKSSEIPTTEKEVSIPFVEILRLAGLGQRKIQMSLPKEAEDFTFVFKYSFETRHCDCGESSWPVYKLDRIERR